MVLGRCCGLREVLWSLRRCGTLSRFVSLPLDRPSRVRISARWASPKTGLRGALLILYKYNKVLKILRPQWAVIKKSERMETNKR